MCTVNISLITNGLIPRLPTGPGPSACLWRGGGSCLDAGLPHGDGGSVKSLNLPVSASSSVPSEDNLRHMHLFIYSF